MTEQTTSQQHMKRVLPEFRQEAVEDPQSLDSTQGGLQWWGYPTCSPLQLAQLRKRQAKQRWVIISALAALISDSRHLK